MYQINDIDTIIHCAASTPPKYSQNQCYKNNRNIDDLIFSFAKRKKINNFIYLSSMSIYGKKKNKIVKENNSPKKLDLYGLSKLNSEKKLLKISNKVIKSILILRLSSILGKNSHSTFLSNLKRDFSKKEIQIKNKSKLFNGCFHINDLAIFINKLLKNSEKKGRDFINIASFKPVKFEKKVNLFKKKISNK